MRGEQRIEGLSHGQRAKAALLLVLDEPTTGLDRWHAVTAIPGVVFSGAVDGHLRAYSSSTGEVLWDTDTARSHDTVSGQPARGDSIDVAGPAVVNGMVYVNSGYGRWGGMPGNVLSAFSLQ